MAVEGADFLPDDDLHAQVGTPERIFLGPQGSLEGVVIGDGNDLEAGLRGDFYDLAGRVKPVREIGMKV
jgi:hypothetical protein